MNRSFLSPLKRQRAVRNRGNNASPSSSKRANCLPPLSELSAEDSPRSSCSSSSSPPSCSPAPTNKRQSRYGRDEFRELDDSGDYLDDNFLLAAPRPAPRPPIKHAQTAPAHPTSRQTVRLSMFDILFDPPTSPELELDSEPTSPMHAPQTPPPTRRAWPPASPPRHSRSPSPSLTNTSVCSSEMPMTPLTSDDEWPGLELPRARKPVLARQVPIRPLVITKSAPALPSPEASPADTFEFTLAPFPGDSFLDESDSEAEDEEEEQEDDAAWYSRELGAVVALFSLRTPPNTAAAAGPARPDSLLPPPPRRSRHSKPLPALPRTPGPSATLDPTFPRAKPAPTHALPPPPTPARRKASLTITVPPPPHAAAAAIAALDILDDAASWAPAPSVAWDGAPLSPPRVPESPAPSASSRAGFACGIELVVDAPAPAQVLRSRWSCSTLAAEPPVTSASARLKLHLGSVRALDGRLAAQADPARDVPAAVNVTFVDASPCSR
ncbi:hypothetical protein BC834DRAFT_82336 [Gloeopeniophorella convolvens]|nr:hypothetical protein BC834DRAFT_82336 [Gloeopeniophorella convolvens]